MSNYKGFAAKPPQKPYPNIFNGSGQNGDTSGWKAVETSSLTGTMKTLTVDTTEKFSGSNSLRINPGSIGTAYAAEAIAVVPGKRIKIKFAIRTNQVWTGNGLYMRLLERTTYPEGGTVCSNLGTAACFYTSWTDLVGLGGSPIATANQWIEYAFTYTVPAGVYWISPSTYSWSPAPLTASLWFEWLEFTEEVPTPTLVSKVTGVSGIALLGTLTTLLTVPAGRSFDPTGLFIKCRTSTGSITASPRFSVGNNAPTYDNLMTSTILTGVVAANRMFNVPVVGALPIFQSGDIISVQLDTPATGATALLYDFELYGVMN
jgi:hypothetical protein